MCAFFSTVEIPKEPRTLDDLTPAIELYYHTVRSGELDKAIELYKNYLDPWSFKFGIYILYSELAEALFGNGGNLYYTLKDEVEQAWVLNELANMYKLKWTTIPC